MVIDDNTLGGGWIPNPNYNKKTKKLGVAPYIQSQQEPRLEDTVANNFYNSNPSLSYVVRDSNTGQVADTSKYIEHGVTPNRIDNLENILADKQGTWSKLWNATKQSIWSELILGSVQGLADIAGGLASAVTYPYYKITNQQGQQDYNNAASDYLEKARRAFEENNPIYVRDDASWYNPSSIISHIPSIAGIASMVIPSTGAVKGVSLVGRALGAGKLATTARIAMTTNRLMNGTRLAKFANSARGVQLLNTGAELTANGLTNAAMWSYAEARNVYSQNYQYASQVLGKLKNSHNQEDQDAYNDIITKNKNLLDGVNTEDYDAVAKRLSGRAADETFGTDMLLNSIFSTLSYYGLRNVWNGVKNARVTTGMRQLQRESKLFAGVETPYTPGGTYSPEAKKIIDGVDRWTKAKWKIGDWAASNKGVIYSQAIGVPQMTAVGFGSYWGLNYGKVLLNQTPASPWDDRLEQYLRNADTWESAIYGGLAGIAFHFVGSGIKALERKAEAKWDARKVKNRQTSDAARKQAEDLFKADAVDVRARKMAILKRSAEFDEYVRKINTIRDGKNPYSASNGSDKLDTVDSGSPLEEELLHQAESEYAANRISSALSTGTLKLERGFMESEEVRKALAKRLNISDEESVATQKRILEQMDKAERWYDNDLTHTMNEIQRMNDKRSDDKKIPMQYAHYVAKDNVDIRMDLDTTDDVIRTLENKINTKVQQLQQDGNLPVGIDYKDYYTASITAQMLGALYDERRKLQETGSKDASTVYSLTRINEQIKAIENKIQNAEDATSDKGIGRTLFIMHKATGYRSGNPEVNGGKPYIDNDVVKKASSEYFQQKDSELITNIGLIAEKFGIQGLNEERGKAIRKEYDRYNGRWQLGASGADQVAKADKDLASDMMSLAAYGVSRVIKSSQLSYTTEQLEAKFHSLDNIYDVARREMLDAAAKTIFDIHRDHFKEDKKAVDMMKIVQDYANDGNLDSHNELSDSEKARLKDAFDIFNLTDSDNANIYTDLQRSLAEITFYELNAKDQQTANKSKEDKINGDTNANQENTTTNQNQSQSLQNNQQSNSSTQPQQSDNGSESRQNNNSQSPQLIPQEQKSSQSNAPTVTPATPTQTDKRAEIITNVIPSESNDGTFTFNYKGDERNKNMGDVRIVPTDNPDEFEVVGNGQKLPDSFISNSQLYDVQGDPLNDTLVPVNNPIIKLNRDNNTFIVVNKGTTKVFEDGDVRSDDNINNQGRTAYEENPINLGDIDEAEATRRGTTSSSTGEQQPTPTPAKPNVPEAPVDIALRTTLFRAKNAMMTAAQQTGKTISIDDLKNGFIKEAIHIGKDVKDPVVQRQIQSNAEMFFKTMPSNVKDASPEQKNIADLVNAATENIKEEDARQSSVDELIPETFAPQADKVIEDYIKRVGTIESDGRKYVSQEGLLRYANSVEGTRAAADVLQTILKSYLASDTGKAKYYTEDLTSTDEEIFNNVNTEVSERLKQIVNPNEFTRANVRKYWVDHPSERQDVSNALNSVVFGSALDFEVYTENKYGDKRIAIKIGNTRVADMPIIKYNPTTNDYRIGIQHTNMDIRETSNGLRSNFIERMKTLMNDNSATGTHLNGIILQYNNEQDADVRKNLRKDFKKYAKDTDLLGNYITNVDEASMSYLSNLWNYINSRRKLYVANPNALVQDREASMDAWTEKLHRNYKVLNLVAEHPNDYKLTVAKISDGQINLVTRDSGGDLAKAYDNAKPVADKGTIGSMFTDKIKIGIVDPDVPGQIGVSGIGYVRGGAKANSTFMMFPNRNGTWQEVNVYGQKFGESSISDTGKQIIAAFTDEIGKQIDAMKAAGYNQTNARRAINELYRLFKQAYYSTNNSLFDGLRVYQDANGIHLYNDRTGDNIYFNFGGVSINHISEFNSKTGKAKVFDFTKGVYAERERYANGNMHYNWDKAKDNEQYIDINELKKGLAKFIIDSSNFKLATDHILHDVDGRDTYGLTAIEDGKFTINIGDKKFQFDSYNDFIIKNNLVRVNTESKDGITNYDPISDGNPRAGQNLEFKIEPVSKGSKQEIPVGQTESYRTRVENEINSNGTKHGENTGQKIAEILLGEDATIEVNKKGVKKPKFKVINTSLLPKNIIFDPHYNELNGYQNVNAESNVGTTNIVRGNTTLKPGTVIVGEKFMKLLDTENGRKRAVKLLVHERLHQILHNGRYDYYVDNDGIEHDKQLDKNWIKQNRQVDKIREVYEDFRNAIAKEPANSHIREFLFEKYYDKDGKPTERSLEEFLVESLTNSNLIDRLNQIKVDVPETKIKESLFSKILRKLGEIFGWNIKEGSLYEKEVKALADVLKEKKEPPYKEDVHGDYDKTLTVDNNQLPKASKKTPESKLEFPKGKPAENKTSGDVFLDDDADDPFASSVDEIIIDDDAVSTDRQHKVNDDAFYDKLPLSEKSAYKQMRDAGLIKTTCHA